MFPNIELSKKDLDELLGMKYVGDVVESAGKISEDLFREKTQKLEVMVDGVDNDLVYQAVFHQNLKNIPFEKQQKVIALASDRQQFKRAIILSVIKNKNNHLDLTPVEVELIEGLMKITPLIDQLFVEWREVVVNSPLGRKFADDPSLSSKFRKENELLTIPYVFSVIQKGEEYKEVSLIKAFPNLVPRIVENIRELSASLMLHDADKEITDYLDAYADLYENDDPEKYEFYSKNLDALWLQITGRIIPIHACEVYEDPGKYIVSQEFGIAFIDDRHKDINEGILKTKDNLFAYFDNNFKDMTSLQESIPLMQKANAAVYTMIAESGARLIFRPFGQNLPNWDEVRFNEGVRIFIDMNSAKIRWEDQRKMLIKIFGEDEVKNVFDVYADDGRFYTYPAIVNVGGHEVAHNAFITLDVQERITPPIFAKLEETKASFAILSTISDHYSEEEQKIIVLSELGSDIMNLSQEDNLAKVAYLNTALASLSAAFGVRLIDKEKDTYIIDASQEKIQKYIERIQKMFSEMVDVYDHGNSNDAERFMDLNFTHTGDIEDLAKVIKENK